MNSEYFDQIPNLQSFRINGALLTRNEGETLARAHWAKAAKAKKQETARVAAIIKGAHLAPVSGPIDVVIVFYEKKGRYKNGKPKKLHDQDNWFYGTKPILDAMVAEGIIPDDSPKYVRRVIPAVSYTDSESYAVVKFFPHQRVLRLTFGPIDID